MEANRRAQGVVREESLARAARPVQVLPDQVAAVLIGRHPEQTTAWKHGMVQPERMRHVVNGDCSHTITLTLEAEHVEYVPPKHLTRPAWGASTPEGADGKKR
jgi:hypothetical protein